MTNSAPILLSFILALFMLSSCGDTSPGTEEVVSSATAEVENVNTAPSLDIIEEHSMEKDVVEYTAEAAPEKIDAEKMPEPAIKPVTNKITKATAKPAQKPEQDVLQSADPVTAPVTTAKETTEAAVPAPVSSSTAPATAPTQSARRGPDEAKVDLGTAPANVKEVSTTAAPAPKPDHAAWNALLQQYVNAAGNVNYAGLKQAEAKLDAYLAELKTEAPGSGWNRTEAMAYWINAYNAGTVKLILKNWPVKSITDLHAGKPWDVKWLELGGKTYSLNQIENEILRPRYKDPRIHFAVNCAAASCPPLANQAFTATNLNALLEARAKAFIRNGSYNTLGDPAKVSKIFEWYGEDFGDLRTYLNKYAGTPLPEGTEIQFKDYDWALNKQ